MGIQGRGWSAVTGGFAAAKACDSCKSSAAVLFCRADVAFLCLACDARIHAANKLGTRRLERVWMCEVCEQAPAAVTCKADAAALCLTCDADIHSANPLARRHDRVPVEPFFDSAESLIAKSTAAANGLSFSLHPNNDVSSNAKGMENDAAANWLIPNPSFISKLELDISPEIIKSSPGDLFLPEMDSLLEFDYWNPIHRNISGADSVVPVQPDPVQLSSFNSNQKDCFDLDFCGGKLSSSFSYPANSFGQSVSSSSLDVGVVPDGNSMSDTSFPIGRNVSQSVSDPSAAVSAASTASQPAIPLSGLDREARVLRYREKRKNRKFQKTIRYASRKAYAETRPRIKGRFAKRTETETEVVDHIYGSNAGAFISEPS